MHVLDTHSSKLFCMSSLPASMKRIRSRTAEKKWQHRFFNYKSMGNFSDAQGQLILQSVVVSGRISNSSKLSCMSSLPVSLNGSNEKQLRKSGNIDFLDTHGGQLCGQIWPNFKLIQALMYVIVTCKYENDQIKNS